MIFIYPDYAVDPVKKWKFLYYQVTDILFVFSVFRDNPFLFSVLHNLTCNRTGRYFGRYIDERKMAVGTLYVGRI